ncbi:MAG TPA: hypothetical protein VFF11_02105 [Candidatus Binatia bacterium]|nr:hypothetical protein [Candidatus Binatia bacterium]
MIEATSGVLAVVAVLARHSGFVTGGGLNPVLAAEIRGLIRTTGTTLELRASVGARTLSIHFSLTAGAEILTGVHPGAASFLSLRRSGGHSCGSQQRCGCGRQDGSF